MDEERKDPYTHYKYEWNMPPAVSLCIGILATVIILLPAVCSICYHSLKYKYNLEDIEEPPPDLVIRNMSRRASAGMIRVHRQRGSLQNSNGDHFSLNGPDHHPSSGKLPPSYLSGVSSGLDIVPPPPPPPPNHTFLLPSPRLTGQEEPPYTLEPRGVPEGEVSGRSLSSAPTTYGSVIEMAGHISQSHNGSGPVLSEGLPPYSIHFVESHSNLETHTTSIHQGSETCPKHSRTITYPLRTDLPTSCHF